MKISPIKNIQNWQPLKFTDDFFQERNILVSIQCQNFLDIIWKYSFAGIWSTVEVATVSEPSLSAVDNQKLLFLPWDYEIENI